LIDEKVEKKFESGVEHLPEARRGTSDELQSRKEARIIIKKKSVIRGFLTGSGTKTERGKKGDTKRQSPKNHGPSEQKKLDRAKKEMGGRKKRKKDGGYDRDGSKRLERKFIEERDT